MTGRVAVVVMALAALAGLTAKAAWAASSEAEKEARAHFQAGEASFKAGAFDEALAEYQKGYDAKPLPGFLVNIAQCQRRLGDLKKARATYQKFILVAPDSPLVPQVRSMIAEIDGLLEKEDENAPAAPGGDAKPEVAIAAPAPAAPVLVAAAPAPAPAASPEQPRHRWWLWGAIGAVVVGGAVTAVALSTGGTTTIHDGSLATLRR
jgi:tetratricopeptide (TPR) repeat protein